MFTGLVSAIGRVESVEDGARHRLTLSCPYDSKSLTIGCSISHAGACLTVTGLQPIEGGSAYTVDVSPETLAKTTLGDFATGSRVNLERALRVGDELGGHIVTGHVDGLGEVLARNDADGWTAFQIAAPAELSRFIAAKGSITVDGVSLTVNAVEGHTFTVMIIPHTAEVTTLGQLQPRQAVNLEVDLMARYAARLTEGVSVHSGTRP